MPQQNRQSVLCDAAAVIARLLILLTAVELFAGLFFGANLIDSSFGVAWRASTLTLLCFGLFGLALLQSARGRATTPIAATLVIIGVADIAMIASGVEQGLNKPLIEWVLHSDWRAADRMAPATAAMLIWMAAALMMANRWIAAARRAASLGLVVACGLLLSLPLGLAHFTENTALSGTSPETAFLFVAGFGGVVLRAHSGGWPELLTLPTPASRATRRIAPLLLLPPLVLVLLARAADAYRWESGDIILGVVAAGVSAVSLALLFSGASALNASLAELARLAEWRELLIRELNHRTKNNMQQMISIIGIQKDRASHAETRAALEALSGRIRTLRDADRILSEHAETHGEKTVDMRPLISAVCASVSEAIDLQTRGVRLNLRAAAVEVEGQLATPLALIANELATNAAKHAFPNGRGGRIDVVIGPASSAADAGVELVVEDDGVGPAESSTDAEGLGRLIVKSLCEQIGATYADAAVPSGGFRATVVARCDGRAPTGNKQ